MNNRFVVEVFKILINCNVFVDFWENDYIKKNVFIGN